MGIPEGIRHRYIAVPGDDMQPKVLTYLLVILLTVIDDGGSID